MNIKKVELVLENCECLTFTYPDFFFLNLLEMSEKLSTYTNCIEKYKITKGFAIAINEAAVAVDYHSFTEEDNNWVKRLEYCDVTQVVLTYDNNQEEGIYVDGWDEGWTHKGQKLIKKDGYIIFKSEYDLTEETLDSIELLYQMVKGD